MSTCIDIPIQARRHRPSHVSYICLEDIGLGVLNVPYRNDISMSGFTEFGMSFIMSLRRVMLHVEFKKRLYHCADFSGPHPKGEVGVVLMVEGSVARCHSSQTPHPDTTHIQGVCTIDAHCHLGVYRAGPYTPNIRSI